MKFFVLALFSRHKTILHDQIGFYKCLLWKNLHEMHCFSEYLLSPLNLILYLIYLYMGIIKLEWKLQLKYKIQRDCPVGNQQYILEENESFVTWVTSSVRDDFGYTMILAMTTFIETQFFPSKTAIKRQFLTIYI